MTDYLQYVNLLGEIFKPRIPKSAYIGSWVVSSLAISFNVSKRGYQVYKETNERECPLNVKDCQGCVTNNKKRVLREIQDQTIVNVVPTFGFLPLYASTVAKIHPVASLVTTPFMVYKLDNFMIDLVNVNRLSRPTQKNVHLQAGDPLLQYKWPNSNY